MSPLNQPIYFTKASIFHYTYCGKIKRDIKCKSFIYFESVGLCTTHLALNYLKSHNKLKTLVSNFEILNLLKKILKLPLKKNSQSEERFILTKDPLNMQRIASFSFRNARHNK